MQSIKILVGIAVAGSIVLLGFCVIFFWEEENVFAERKRKIRRVRAARAQKKKK